MFFRLANVSQWHLFGGKIEIFGFRQDIHVIFELAGIGARTFRYCLTQLALLSLHFRSSILSSMPVECLMQRFETHARIFLILILTIVVILLQAGVSLTAAERNAVDDWPMYRKDAGRQGVTQSELPDNLQLAWSKQLLPLTPAFQNKRLQFDAGYEPVVAEGKLLVASSLTDSVKAFDTQTGQLVWTHYTNGPVRFAPAIWNDSVCFGSDDGYLYCVDLHSGMLRWKQQAVPSERLLMGNRRLISVWPVRGGPVVKDGVVYFAAGVWPFEGVFVYAMQIETGKVVWRNDRMGYLFGQQPHNTQAIGGLAPQGYLLIDEDELIVPCSTAYPARLSRLTGELIDFELPSAGRYPGGWFAALDPDQARALRRGKLTFDETINSQKHEDKVHRGQGGVAELSREIRTPTQTLSFDQPKVDIKGPVHAMLIADNALFVVNKSGEICCYRDSQKMAGKPSVAPAVKRVRLQVSPAAKIDAEAIIQKAASKHGVAVVFGLDDGELAKALVDGSQCHVVVLDDQLERCQNLRRELDLAGLYGTRAAVIHCDLESAVLPPYMTSVMVTERHELPKIPSLQTLRPFGGVAINVIRVGQATDALEQQGFTVSENADAIFVERGGALPGANEYAGNWALSEDQLVRFPLGVLWFDDTLAHFKRSPQPRFNQGEMISRPKDWRAPRIKGNNKVDYPLLPPVLSDIYTGRVLDDSERMDLRSQLTATSPSIAEPSQYRPPRQQDDWSPKQPVVGQRKNPITGEMEPRAFLKTYGCDGGVDYGDLYTLRSGTAAFYDKKVESGTVFLSGPRSGCTNSIIPSGGVLNVPYFYEGCTCSYPLPTAMSLVAMPEQHEQWASWGKSEIPPGKIQRIGINFGAPGDRISRSGTLWLDYPSVGGPSPIFNAKTSGMTRYRYQHSLWMKGDAKYPWVNASAVEGLREFTITGLKPGNYTVRLYFNEPDSLTPGERVQSIELQGKTVQSQFDVVVESGGSMKAADLEFSGIQVQDELKLGLSSSRGVTLLSGLELIRKNGQD
jgi:outer membrane protein assembly factor BamB